MLIRQTSVSRKLKEMGNKFFPCLKIVEICSADHSTKYPERKVEQGKGGLVCVKFSLFTLSVGCRCQGLSGNGHLKSHINADSHGHLR